MTTAINRLLPRNIIYGITKNNPYYIYIKLVFFRDGTGIGDEQRFDLSRQGIPTIRIHSAAYDSMLETAKTKNETDFSSSSTISPSSFLGYFIGRVTTSTLFNFLDQDDFICDFDISSGSHKVLILDRFDKGKRPSMYIDSEKSTPTFLMNGDVAVKVIVALFLTDLFA
jgi:hypothetical protein